MVEPELCVESTFRRRDDAHVVIVFVNELLRFGGPGRVSAGEDGRFVVGLGEVDLRGRGEHDLLDGDFLSEDGLRSSLLQAGVNGVGLGAGVLVVAVVGVDPEGADVGVLQLDDYKGDE